MFKTQIIIIAILSFTVCNCQETNSYEKISFETFLKTQTTDSNRFVKLIYKDLYYNSTQENEKDKDYRILMMCSGHKKYQLIGMDSNDMFTGKIKKVLDSINAKYLISNNSKYFVEIPIKVDFEPHEDFDYKNDLNRINLFSYSIIKVKATHH